jgi:phage terminase large subunit GpA-like protein
MMAKEFAGGTLILTGANSPIGSGLRRSAICSWTRSTATRPTLVVRGDPIALATARTETFSRRKVLMTSTPTLKGYSRIEAAYEESDRRMFFVPCIHCGDFAPITWHRIQWPQGYEDQAYLVCESCGGVMHDHHKPQLLSGGRWTATAVASTAPGNALATPLSRSGAAAGVRQHRFGRNLGGFS